MFLVFWARCNGNDKHKEDILEPTNRLGQKDRLYEIAEPIVPSGVAKKCVDAKLGHTFDKELDRSM
jgi:hypothetical protein